MGKGILIFGLNGSGKTTLGRVLASTLNYKAMDIEDYFFLPSDIPYSRTRPKYECNELILNDMKHSDGFVFSVLKRELTKEILEHIELGVFLDVPDEIRYKRVEERMHMKFGDRIKVGGDMYASEQAFMTSVRSKSLNEVITWADFLECPIIKVDGRKATSECVKEIIDKYNQLKC